MEEYKLIVAGGRNFTDKTRLIEELRRLGTGCLQNKEVSIVSGMARGADRLAYQVANLHNVPVHEFPADWNTYGKSAGFRRNAEMAEFADGLLAFWDGKSRGTKHMIETMQAKGKPVRVINY